MFRNNTPPQSFSKLGKRRNGRLALPIDGQLLFTAGTCPVTTINVSRTGALVQVARPVKCGADAVLRILGLDLLCTVIWTKNERCGLCFHQPLTDRQMQSFQHASDAPAEQRTGMAASSSHYWR